MAGPASSTVLHETEEDKDSLKIYVAARSGKKEKVLQILDRRPELIYYRNKIGDNPLHVAAEAGQLGIVELLTVFQSLPTSQSSGSTENRAEEIPSMRNDETRIVIQEDGTDALNNSLRPPQSSQGGVRGNTEIKPIWKSRNHYGNTALHEAIRNKHEDVALHLLDVDSELVKFANYKNESPLYLAAKAACVRVLRKILDVGGHYSVVGPMDRTPFHAAVFARSQESTEVLYGSIASLIGNQDSYGKTALYYATQEDSLEITRQLLGLDASSALIRDKEGLSPLLVAARNGCSAFVLAILNACPASIDLLDNTGRNALHLAVYSTIERFKKLLSFPKLKALANKVDNEGNTPLHLAAKEQKYDHIQALLYSTKVESKAWNKAGKKALDLLDPSACLSSEQKQIRDALNGTYAVHSLFRYVNPVPELVNEKLLEVIQDKDLSQTTSAMSVVAALIATITFAAALQIPGGYNPSDGSPTLIHAAALKAFVLTDAIAFCLSLVALCCLVVASTNDKVSSANVNALLFGGALLISALFSATIAFVSGIYVVISIESQWVAILVSVICCCAVFCGSCFIPEISDLFKKIRKP